VAALAFIGDSEPWHKTGIEGWRMNGVEKENNRTENKRKRIKRRENLWY
jgi:hypothetical protein